MYRLVEMGEVIQDGDEWYDEGVWRRSESTGLKYVIDIPVRRLVKPAVTPAAEPVKPAPGEGWRLLKEGEKVEQGDEYYSKSVGWVPSDNWRTNGKQGTNPAFVLGYRRRVTQPAPVVSVGDRVKVLSGPWAGCTGVVIALDAYVLLSDYGKMTAKYDSTPVIELDHVRVGGHKLILNKVTVEKLPPVVPEVLYRDLAIGETIRIEDEYMFCGGWLAGLSDARCVGKKMEQYHVRHRRPVRIQSPGWRYLDAGETVQDGDHYDYASAGWCIHHMTAGTVSRGDTSFRRKLPANVGG